MHRFYTSAFDPVYFDKSDLGRFNADASFGVLYGAKEIQGAFAETILRMPGSTMIDGGFLKKESLRPLVGDAGAATGQPDRPRTCRRRGDRRSTPFRLAHHAPQALSRAIFNHSENVDGIAYHARYDDTELCYAIFERDPTTINQTVHELDLDADWFWWVAEEYGTGLAP